MILIGLKFHPTALPKAPGCLLDTAQNGTYPGAEVNLEDGTIQPATEHVVFRKVEGHWHDAHIEDDREEKVPGGDLPQLRMGKGAD